MDHRLAALDWMRGIVILLMAADHSSHAFNGGQYVTDAWFMYQDGHDLPAAQFLTRWVTHLCAPAFLFLAGTSLYLSIARKQARGERTRAIDRDLLVRGALIALLDPLYVNFFWESQVTFFQVLFAIGMSMILMIPLRRLPAWTVAALGAACLVASEAIVRALLEASGAAWPSIPLGYAMWVYVYFGGGFIGESGGVWLVYPILPWLSMMALGWGFGHWLAERPAGENSNRAAAAFSLKCGAGLLGLFLALRGLNGYGNMMLYRENWNVLQWLHVSKYPPSLTFALLELGLMFAVLAGLFRMAERLGGRVNPNQPVLVFGQTALFFYLAHIPLIEISASLTGLRGQLGVESAWLGALAAAAVLYYPCRLYRGYKKAHPRSWARFI